MERTKSLTIVIRAEEINMTIEMGSSDEQPKEARDKRIVKILEQFSRLLPEKQEEVMKFIEYLGKKTEQKEGQGPVT